MPIPWVITDPDFLDWLRDRDVDLTRLSQIEAEAWYDDYILEADDEWWFDDL